MRAYVASTLDNGEEASRIAEALEQDGWEITYKWYTHGSAQALGEARIREVAEAEIEGVLQADLLVLVLPGGRGSHVEFGGALMIIRLRMHELWSGAQLGPRAVIVYGRGEEAMRQRPSAVAAFGFAPEPPGAFHDTNGRICSFYLHPGVHLVEKDRGLDGLRLEALRVTGQAPRPKVVVAAEVAS